MGPSFDMIIRRTKFASEDMMRQALKIPASVKSSKVKNITKDEFAKRGIIHVQQENLATLQQKKQKGLRVSSKRKAKEGKEEQNPSKRSKTE